MLWTGQVNVQSGDTSTMIKKVVTEIKSKIHNQQSLTITFFTHLPNFLILIIQNNSSNRICNYDDSYEFIFLYAMLEIESLICSYHLNTLLDGYKEN